MVYSAASAREAVPSAVTHTTKATVMAIRRAPLPVVWFDIDILLSVLGVAGGRGIAAVAGIPMVVAAQEAEGTSRSRQD